METFDAIGTGSIGNATAILVRSRLDSKKELLIPNLVYVSSGLWYHYNGGVWTKLANLINAR